VPGGVLCFEGAGLFAVRSAADYHESTASEIFFFLNHEYCLPLVTHTPRPGH
jgi:hypothetical protein